MAEQQVIGEREWTPRAQAHRDRVQAFTGAHVQPGETHPVWDFLFTYYSLRPRRLRVWHPGYGTALAGAGAAGYLDRAGYVAVPEGVTVGAAYLRSRIPTVGFVAGLLRSTADRAPRFGCFGMHEWAMVYRTGAVRHARVPLRLGVAGTDAVVESGRPTRATQSEWEQPGCLHATMDLYKLCYKLGPLVDSTVLMDCLELAARARELDMRAGPYELATRAAPLRAALLRRCEGLLAVGEQLTGG